ncbi:MAG: hypothetical protein AAB686_02475 [Patescibacteria group bacterium]
MLFKPEKRLSPIEELTEHWPGQHAERLKFLLQEFAAGQKSEQDVLNEVHGDVQTALNTIKAIKGEKIEDVA